MAGTQTNPDFPWFGRSNDKSDVSGRTTVGFSQERVPQVMNADDDTRKIIL